MSTKILLVDDEPDFTDPIEFWLKKRDFEVAVVNNGEDAIKNIKENKPDIVFMDINMPGLSGVETLERIREFDSELPVIMLTAYGTGKDLKKAADLKISGFFPKQSEYTDLLKVIDTTLRTHKKI
jgi:DNA-binding response OmpR family regulator